MAKPNPTPGREPWPCPACGAAAGERCVEIREVADKGEPLHVRGWPAIHGLRLKPIVNPTSTPEGGQRG